MNDLLKLQELYRLKEVDRACKVNERFESSAEHTYSCLILADYLFSRVKQKLDREKVFRLLLYHDIVEIYAGDVFSTNISDGERAQKRARETEALTTLSQKVPSSTAKEVCSLWLEFEHATTPEGQFAQAIDKFDPIIQCLPRKDLWKKHQFTEATLRQMKEPALKPFPELVALFNELVTYLKENNYFAE